MPAAVSDWCAQVKNRFGAANEVGVFAMTEQGLKEVKNPSAIFLSQHAQPVSRQRSHGCARGQQADADRSASADRRSARHESAACRGRSGSESPRACCSRCCIGTAALRPRAAMCSSTSSAACAFRDRRPICPPCSRPFRACADEPLAGRLVCFGELGLAGEIRPGAVRRGAIARGCQARLRARDRAEREHAAARDRWSRR